MGGWGRGWKRETHQWGVGSTAFHCSAARLEGKTAFVDIWTFLSTGHSFLSLSLSPPLFKPLNPKQCSPLHPQFGKRRTTIGTAPWGFGLPSLILEQKPHGNTGEGTSSFFTCAGYPPPPSPPQPDVKWKGVGGGEFGRGTEIDRSPNSYHHHTHTHSHTLRTYSIREKAIWLFRQST